MRNPKYWTLSNEVFVLAPGCTPVDAISDLWAAHGNDGVPIPRIRCYKYSSLALVQGHIEYLRESGNATGLAAPQSAVERAAHPPGTAQRRRRPALETPLQSGRLLPGDQAWVDNPFFDRGRKLLRQEDYEQLLREGVPPAKAAAEAKDSCDALIAGEEGSNVFCLGDDKLIRGAFSLSRLCRDTFQADGEAGLAHEQVFTPMIFTHCAASRST